MRNKIYRKRVLNSILLLLNVCWVSASFAGIEPYQNSIRHLKKGDTLIVHDEKFRNSAYDWTNIQNHTVKNIISLELSHDTVFLIKKDFSCELTYKIEYFSQPGQVKPIIVDQQKLKVNYSRHAGALSKLLDSYSFSNGHWVKVTIQQITCPELGDTIPPVIQLKSQVVIDRQYVFQKGHKLSIQGNVVSGSDKLPSSEAPSATNLMASINPSAPSGGTLHITWNPVVGAEEYDLEWTTAEQTSEYNPTIQAMLAGQPVNTDLIAAIFKNNSTRVTTHDQQHTISLVFNTHFILVRLRQVHYTNGIRIEDDWDYQLDQPNTWAAWNISTFSHEPALNWQYNSSYAEEGKKKEVINYFDGSLHARQTVTLNNTDKVAVVQENIMDEFSRPFASILPAPVKDNTLRFFRNFNLNTAGKPYNYTNIPSTGLCEPSPEVLSFAPAAAGASQYYSANNEFKNDPLFASHKFHKYIPDAEGYPLTVTQYTPDNTGRIKLQGGVGKAFQPGLNDPSRTTKYYYGKPETGELERLFGSDVGKASHYLKNMVIDPNGQISLSYLNSSGKTIATALTGSAPSGMQDVTGKSVVTTQTVEVLSPERFVFDPGSLQLSATTTYLASVPGAASLQYDIKKLINSYSKPGFTICSNCYYDLSVGVYNDCNTLVYKTQEPVPVGALQADCNAAGAATSTINVNFQTVGEYYITFTLQLSRDVIEDYTNEYIRLRQENGDMRKEVDFISDYLNSSDFSSCYSDCKTCDVSLGSQADFVVAVSKAITDNGVQSSAVYTNWASGLYTALKAQCIALQQTCNLSPCDKIRTDMLADLSPGGQYALFGEDYQALEKGINVIFNHWRQAFPVQQDADPDYIKELITIDDYGTTTSPYDETFTLPMLVQYWKPEWAEKFLQYHPEYCKLQFCFTNSSYFTWDERVNTFIKGANDIANIPGAQPGLQYDRNNGSWLLNTDPFFSQAGSPGAIYKSSMQADLNQYSQRLMNLNDSRLQVKSVTQFIDYSLYCSDPSATTNTGMRPDVWNNCIPAESCRIADREWRTYKDIYLELKEGYYKKARDLACVDMCVIGRPVVLSTSCAGIRDFSISVVDEQGLASCGVGQKLLRLSYLGGAVAYNTFVHLYYPSEYQQVLQSYSYFAFDTGEQDKIFCVPANVEVGSIRIKSVTCEELPLSTSCPFGAATGTLNLLPEGYQSGNNQFTDASGSNGDTRTFTIVSGTSDNPPAESNYCVNGTFISKQFYNCYSVYLPNTVNALSYYNVWVIQCSSNGCIGSSFYADYQINQNLYYATIGNQGYYYTIVDQGPESPPPGGEECDESYSECFTVYYGEGQSQSYQNAWIVICPTNNFGIQKKGGTSADTASKASTTAGVKALSAAKSGSSKADVASTNAYPCAESDFSIVGDGSSCSATTALYHVFVKEGVPLCPGKSAVVNVYYNNGTLLTTLSFSAGDVSKDICIPKGIAANYQFTLCGNIIGSCSTGSGSEGYCDEAYQYKTSHFPEPAPIDFTAPDITAYQAQTLASLTETIRSSCQSKADDWMDRLSDGTTSFTTAQLTALKTALIDVCTKGGDLDHLFGASTVIPGRFAINNYTSFKDAMKASIGNAAFNELFNPWLLDAPYPYSPSAQLAEKIINKTDPDICSRLQVLQQQYAVASPGVSFYAYLGNRYGDAFTLSEAELGSLIQGCTNCRFLLPHDLTLPVFLDPKAVGSITKTDFDAAMTDLAAEFGTNGLDASHKNYEAIVRNYLNFRWGFALSFSDYDDYRTRILTDNTAILVNKVPYSSVAVEPYDCLRTLVGSAVVQGLKDYQAYLQEQRRLFKASYVNTCSKAAAKVNLTSSYQTYHYTLYYYDQAGNLVRTVPPEGVTLLTDLEVAQVLQARTSTSQNCTYSGPGGNTSKPLTLQWLSDILNSRAAAAIEYWQYEQNGGGGQVLAPTPDNKFLYHSCLKGHYLHVEVFSLQQSDVRDIELVGSNDITVDVSSQLPLHPWSHIVVQSPDLQSSTLAVYVNGSVMPVVAGAPGAGCGWEIAASASPIQLPENLSHIKHLRLYDRLLSGVEIADIAAQNCFGLPALPSLSASLRHWGRFNTPVVGSTAETRITPIYPAHRLATSYAYNSLNQVSKQQSPDGGASHFWYDYLGRLVLSQNQKQRTAGAASYTEFDALSRITEVGERTGASVPAQPSFLSSAALAAATATGSRTQITSTFYDVAAAGLSGLEPSLVQSDLRKRVSASVYREQEGSAVQQASYYDYDLQGNVQTLYQQVSGLPLKQVGYEYDLVSGKVNFVKYQHGQNDRFYYHYSYDADNRLVEALSGTEALVKPQGGSYLLNAQSDALYRYYLHGPLARMELGQQKVQGMDYAYTLQGWLKGVNSTAGTPQHDMEGDGVAGSTVAADEAGYSLTYYPGDYKAVGSGSVPFGDVGAVQGLYNGNISAMSTAVKALSEPLLYKYGYDQLNRLVSMQAHTGLNQQSNSWTPVAMDRYREAVSYDGNGNITQYQRNGNSASPMDGLSYGYSRDGQGRLVSNRLRHVKDEVSDGAYSQDLDNQGDDNYGYDEIGNLTRDSKEGITGIDWTVYGKISRIARQGQPAIEYLYDASGNRVSKTVGGTVTRYVRDGQGNVLGVYEQQGAAGAVVWKEQHLYGSSRVGMWQPEVDVSSGTGSGVWGVGGKKRYELTNHLGNVLGVVSDEKVYNGSSYDAVVVSAADYAPFGMGLVGRTYNSSGYRYGFNGKENDSETSTQDYGMRIYDPRVARFLSVDPIAKSYPFLTPYAFAENDVISSVDLDGLEKYRVVGRSFAPRGSFEGTHFESKADDRTKFQVADYLKVSARIHTLIEVNLDTWTMTKDISSQPTILKGKIGGDWQIDHEKINAEMMGSIGEKNFTIKGNYSAQNGTNVGPGIDIQFQFDLRRENNSTLIVATNIFGNIFPAQETMIFDQKGTGLFMGTSTATGGPLTGVWGTGENNRLSYELMKVQTNKEGDFLGVYSKDRKGNEIVINPSAYNKKFTDKKVWDQQDGREDYKTK